MKSELNREIEKDPEKIVKGRNEESGREDGEIEVERKRKKAVKRS